MRVCALLGWRLRGASRCLAGAPPGQLQQAALQIPRSCSSVEEIYSCTAHVWIGGDTAPSSLWAAVMDVACWGDVVPSNVCVVESIPGLIKNCVPFPTGVPSTTK